MSLPTIAAFETTHGPLTPAETALIAACKAGEACVLGDGELPPEGKPDPTREVRAALLRLLILGGNEADGLDPKGVWVEGAHVTGRLDLSFQKARGRLAMANCRFAERPSFEQTTFEQLGLDGSIFPGLWAQRVVVSGSLFLRRATASGTVAVNGAKVGGQVDCTGATLDGKGSDALNAQGLDCGQDLFLRGLAASGTVAVNGAKVGGQVDCAGAMLDGKGGMALNAQGLDCGQDLFLRGLTASGTVDVNGARVGGQVDCTGATLDGRGSDALNGQRLRVAQGLIFRDLKSVTGQFYLDAAHVSDLADDASSWPTGEDEVYLDGFTYDRIGEHAPITLADRKDWLARGSRFQGRFHPQPYTQFAKVLREAGNAGEARKVLFVREKALAAEYLWAGYRKADGAFYFPLENLFKDAVFLWRLLTDLLLRWIVGYGHAPQRALVTMLALVLPAAWAYSAGYAQGLMVPNSDVILTSPGWWVSVFQSADAPTLLWDDSRPARHYETFYGLAYALDAFIPFFDLGQQSAWSATTVNWPGWWLRIGTMALEAMGWVVTALGAAAITGIMQRDKE